jgi:Uma2 family endonuclease
MSPTTLEAPRAPETIPPLENGDHLTRAEFERRYEAMPAGVKAELINGRVYVASPVRLRKHGQPHLIVSAWLGTYWAATPGVEAGDNSTVRLDQETEPQPDALLMISPAHGGQAAVDADDYVAGAPELVVEVAASSVSYDLHDKLQAYWRNGVREYITWRILDSEVDWRVLRAGEYVLLHPGDEGYLRSEVFPGLWLDPHALVKLDMAGVLDVLRQGLASLEHAAFVASLSKK